MAKTKKNLFIHGGYPKCASTSLQDFLFLNKEPLQNKGFLYPAFENKNILTHERTNGFDISLFILNDNNEYLNKRFDTLNFPEQERKKYIKNLENSFSYTKQQINDSNLNNIVLSSEFFSVNSSNILKFKNEFKEFNIKFIFYIRTPVSFICSAFQQNAKGALRNTLPLDEYIDKDLELNINYFEKFDDYIEVFGKENIILRPLENEQFKNGCIYSDFLNILGLEPDESFSLLKRNSNESSSFEVTELIRLINRLPYDMEIKNKMRKLALNVQFQNNTKIIDTLTEEQIQKIKNKYDPIISKYAKELLNQDKMFLNDKYEAKVSKTSLNNQDIEDILKTLTLKINI